MNLKTFFVQYSNGSRQIIHCGLESVEQFCNQHFGSAWDDARDMGAHVNMTEHDMEATLADDAKFDSPEKAALRAEEAQRADQAAQAAAAEQARKDQEAADAAARAPASQPHADHGQGHSEGQEPQSQAAPTGDVHVGLTGTQSDTAAGAPV